MYKIKDLNSYKKMFPYDNNIPSNVNFPFTTCVNVSSVYLEENSLNE